MSRFFSDDDDKHTLIAYEFDEPLAALMSSSAKHSAMDFTFRKADSRVCCWLAIYRVMNGQTYSDSEKGNRLVDASKRRHVYCLSADGTL